MGYVVFYINNIVRGNKEDIEKYYKKESHAKAAVTRHNTYKVKYPWYEPNSQMAYCSYAEYEGFFQGMNYNEWLMWKFVHFKEPVKKSAKNGYIVYSTWDKTPEKYYKKESLAKAMVTRINNHRVRQPWRRRTCSGISGSLLTYCSYIEYEKFLEEMYNERHNGYDGAMLFRDWPVS